MELDGYTQKVQRERGDFTEFPRKKKKKVIHFLGFKNIRALPREIFKFDDE